MLQRLSETLEIASLRETRLREVPPRCTHLGFTHNRG